MNRGYAFGFLIVLLVVILGLYVAFTAFQSSREVMQSRPTAVQAESSPVARATAAPPTAAPAITVTLPLTPAMAAAITATVTISAPVVPEPGLPTSPPPEPTAIPTAAPIVPADTPEAAAPPPTPASVPTHQYRLAGPPAQSPDCLSAYICGTVRDAAGNGLEGILVQASNEWAPQPPASTKGGNEAGKYDIPINTAVANWEVVLVDAAGNQISTKVQIQFDVTSANGVRVDWQRTY